ncbi:hypothetical protein SOVF_035300 [Spinacia oleracea]|nr:hypothetical protein SOVF_035300 [Spinacia oleracea]
MVVAGGIAGFNQVGCASAATTMFLALGVTTFNPNAYNQMRSAFAATSPSLALGLTKLRGCLYSKQRQKQRV